MIDLAAITDLRGEYDPGLAKIGFDIENTLFGSVDAEVLYAMVRIFEPGRIIEVGSGHSTAISMAALEANAKDGRRGYLVAIDPDPRVELDPRVDHRRQRLEEVGTGLFEWMFPGDILFIDSSHVWKPGNDVDLLYNQILPAVPRGVVVHVHDIFLPDPYPPQWEDRKYDEQDHLLRLLNTGEWEVLWAAHQVSRKNLKASFASWTPDRWPGSFWMVKL